MDIMNPLPAPTRFDRVTSEGPVPVSHDVLTGFVQKAQALVDAYMQKSFPTLNRVILSVEPGRRYARIVKSDGGLSRSVYCFVDMTNGDILKSESWKKPAKHARGSVYADNATECLGPYGAAYLR